MRQRQPSIEDEEDEEVEEQNDVENDVKEEEEEEARMLYMKATSAAPTILA